MRRTSGQPAVRAQPTSARINRSRCRRCMLPTSVATSRAESRGARGSSTILISMRRSMRTAWSDGTAHVCSSMAYMTMVPRSRAIWSATRRGFRTSRPMCGRLGCSRRGLSRTSAATPRSSSAVQPQLGIRHDAERRAFPDLVAWDWSGYFTVRTMRSVDLPGDIGCGARRTEAGRALAGSCRSTRRRPRRSVASQTHGNRAVFAGRRACRWRG